MIPKNQSKSSVIPNVEKDNDMSIQIKSKSMQKMLGFLFALLAVLVLSCPFMRTVVTPR